MGFRETLNRRPLTTALLLAGLMLAAAALIVGSAWRSVSTGKPHPYAWYSVDDGKSFFRAEAHNIPPFTTPDGKVAVRAIVYRCKPDQPPKVAWLERYTPEARQKLIDYQAKTTTAPSVPPDMSFRLAMQAELEIKKPSEAQWIRMDKSQAFEKVRAITCPEGSSPTPVNPE